MQQLFSPKFCLIFNPKTNQTRMCMEEVNYTFIMAMNFACECLQLPFNSIIIRKIVTAKKLTEKFIVRDLSVIRFSET